MNHPCWAHFGKPPFGHPLGIKSRCQDLYGENLVKTLNSSREPHRLQMLTTSGSNATKGVMFMGTTAPQCSCCTR